MSEQKSVELTLAEKTQIEIIRRKYCPANKEDQNAITMSKFGAEYRLLFKALDAEREAREKVEKELDLLSGKFGWQAYDVMRKQRDEAVHAHQRIDAFYTVAVRDLENFREHHKALEEKLAGLEKELKQVVEYQDKRNQEVAGEKFNLEAKIAELEAIILGEPGRKGLRIEELEAQVSTMREGLQKIVGCHGDDECGFCGSMRIAKEALAKGGGV